MSSPAPTPAGSVSGPRPPTAARDGVHWREELVDGLGRVYRTRAEGATAAVTDVIVTDTAYTDASERPAATSLPHTAGQAPRWAIYRYDPAHRLTSRTHPNSTATTTLTYEVGVVHERDELNALTSRHHDGFGRTTLVDENVRPCASCPPARQSTAYTYDLADRLLTITDAAGLVTTVGRDSAGREISLTDPDRGSRTRTLLADGRIDTETDANGVHTWT